jgi:hypothetical protein
MPESAPGPMPTMPESQEADIDRHVAALERDVGLAQGIYRRLLDEDDWSFVIKLHALLESAMTFLLATRFRDERLHEVFARMELGTRATAGRVSFAMALGLLSQRERRFVAALTELRTSLLPSFEFTRFTFKSYLAGLDVDARRKFLDAFGSGLGAKIALEESAASRKAVVLQNPKLAVWSTAMSCLGSMILSSRSGKRRNPEDEAGDTPLERHLAEFEKAVAQMPQTSP